MGIQWRPQTEQMTQMEEQRRKAPRTKYLEMGNRPIKKKLDEQITERDVGKAINKLTNRTSVGGDEIAAEIFRRNEECIGKVIMELFGNMGTCGKMGKK